MSHITLNQRRAHTHPERAEHAVGDRAHLGPLAVESVGELSSSIAVTPSTQMKEQFSDEQLVEITALLAVVNLDRFNAAFGIGSAGFSEGMVCMPPDRRATSPR